MKQKILFLTSNPKGADEIESGDECRDIRQEIERAKYREGLQLLAEFAVRPRDLVNHLRKELPHIVHFSSHASENRELFLKDYQGNAAAVDEAALVKLFRVAKDNIKMVVLNACHTHAQAKALTKIIDCAVGMSGEISDEAAIIFAPAFYHFLGSGDSVQKAFDSGLAALAGGEAQIPRLLVRKGVDPGKIYFTGPKAFAKKRPKIVSRNKSHRKGPQLLARFQEQHGDLVIISGRKYPVYGMDLWIKGAPPGTKSVTVEVLDASFPEPVWNVPRNEGVEESTRQFLTDDMNSYGDVVIFVQGNGPRAGQWNIETTLYEALVRHHGLRPKNHLIRKALKKIRDN